MPEDLDKDIEKAVPSIGELNSRIESHERTLKIAADEQLKVSADLSETLNPSLYETIEGLATSHERSESLIVDLHWVDAMKAAGVDPDDALRIWDEKIRIRDAHNEEVEEKMRKMGY
jgi:hypothetical protein